ncbi:MAG: GerMN domain-containing protein [Acidimicrobiales bacterium]
MTASRRARGRRGLSLVALLGLLATVGGCGIAEDDGPRALGPRDVPEDLRDPDPSAVTTSPSPGATTVVVYLIVRQGDTTRLEPVEREVADASDPAERLAALLVPPSTEDVQEGLTSSIPADTVLLDTELDETEQELVVDLSSALFDVQVSELANAFAQIVWTVTEQDEVRSVRFRVDGEPQRATNAEGIEQPGAVTRADYDRLAPAR